MHGSSLMLDLTARLLKFCKCMQLSTILLMASANVPMGCFTFSPECGVTWTEPKVSISFQCLSPLRVSVHTQKGGICCSPNNARVVIDDSKAHGMAWLWSLSHYNGRACISLQWMIHDKQLAIKCRDTADKAKDLATFLSLCDGLVHSNPRTDALMLFGLEPPPDTYKAASKPLRAAAPKGPKKKQPCESKETPRATGGGRTDCVGQPEAQVACKLTRAQKRNKRRAEKRRAAAAEASSAGSCDIER